MTNDEEKNVKKQGNGISKEEFDNRVAALKTMIYRQRKLRDLEDLEDKIDEKLINKFLEIDDEENSDNISETVEDYGAYQYYSKTENAKTEAEDNAKRANELIENGATVEDIAKFIKEGYRDKNGKYHDVDFIDSSSIWFTDIKEERADLKDDIVGHNPQYVFDYSVAYYHLARDISKKGIPLEELPAELLFDRRFIGDLIEQKATTKNIDKTFESELISYVEYLKTRETQTQTEDTTKKAERSKHKLTVTELAKAIKVLGKDGRDELKDIADMINKEVEDDELTIDDNAIGDDEEIR